jgi:hypothetical protein
MAEGALVGGVVLDLVVRLRLVLRPNQHQDMETAGTRRNGIVREEAHCECSWEG